MRDTLGKTKESLEFMLKIDKLSQEQRSHMRLLVGKIIDCYVEPDRRAVIVMSKDDEDGTTLITVNCSELEASLTLGKLQDFFMDMNTTDAPPKEKMN